MTRPLPHALLFAGATACGAMERQELPASQPSMDLAREEAAPAGGAPAPMAPPTVAEPEMAKARSATDEKKGEGENDRRADEDQAAQAEDGGARARAWFPESFLFEPLLVTDGEGAASLEIRVPDQLTDWRVLALAHSREGGQAGSETRFATTLPVYLEMAEPPALRAGDRALLPIQAVSDRADGYHGAIEAHVEGAGAWGRLAGAVAIEGRGSRLQYVEVHAERPGPALLRVELADADRVERPLAVQPVGRLLERAQGGTLAAPRSFELLAPFGAQPGSSTLTLVVFPGPLGILAEELERVGAGDGGSLEPGLCESCVPTPGSSLREAAYAYALAGAGRDLATRLGQALDEKKLRRTRIESYQRLVRLARSPSLPDAVLGLAAARTQPDDPLARALTQRLLDQVLAGQSPDGSFAAAWDDGSASLPRALALSALAARWSEGLTGRVRQRAAGFAARNAGYVRDPYTAALLLAAGLVEGRAAEPLRALLVEAVETRPDGTRAVVPGPASLRPDGLTPGVVETSAWTVLALAGLEEHRELCSDLAAGLLGAYRPGRGFGDGLAGLAVLEALARVFDEPLPESVSVRLSLDGAELLARDMTLAGGFEPLVAQALAPAAPGPHGYRIEAVPPIPGLAFALTQRAWLPWSGDPGSEGFSLRVSAPSPAALGRVLPCRLQAAVPGDEAFSLELDLPAGVEVERASLEALQAQGLIDGFDLRQGWLGMIVPPQPAGAVFDATVALVPTLAGSLQWGGAAVALSDEPERRAEAPVGRLEVRLR